MENFLEDQFEYFPKGTPAGFSKGMHGEYRAEVLKQSSDRFP